MEKYVQQLLEDLAQATENLSWPYPDEPLDLADWISSEDEDRTAPTRELESWTGIKKEMFPPAARLSEGQVERLLVAMKKLLHVCNWHFVLQTEVPKTYQYECIRQTNP